MRIYLKIFDVNLCFASNHVYIQKRLKADSTIRNKTLANALSKKCYVKCQEKSII